VRSLKVVIANRCPDSSSIARAGRYHPETDDQGFRVLAREDASPGKDGQGHGSAEGVEQLEATERLLLRGSQHLVGARPAAQLRGRPVGVDDPEVGVDDRHPGFDRVENLREPAGQDSRCLSIRQILDQVTPR